jgi:hypothetical protein
MAKLGESLFMVTDGQGEAGYFIQAGTTEIHDPALDVINSLFIQFLVANGCFVWFDRNFYKTLLSKFVVFLSALNSHRLNLWPAPPSD